MKYGLGSVVQLKMTLRKVGLVSAWLILALSGLGEDSDLAQAGRKQVAELSLDELLEVKVDTVVGGSRYQQKMSEVPSSVTIITDQEIKQYGHRTLADVLRSVPGLYVTYDRTYSYLGLRGFNRTEDYNSRVLLLVDGHRLNDNVMTII